MTTSIQFPFPQFFDTDGDPLDAGYVYVGEVGQDPETHPVALFWDEALTIPAAQPLRTRAGYVARIGTPSRVYVGQDDYSMSVRNSRKVLVLHEQSVAASMTLRDDLSSTAPGKGGALVGFKQSGAGAVAGDVYSKLLEAPISLTDFGAPTDSAGSASDAFDAAIAAAASGNGRIYINANTTFKITRNHVVPASVDVIFGKGGKFDLNGFDITFNGGVDVTSPDIRTGSGNIVLQNSRKNFLSHLMVRGRDDTGISNQDEILQMSTLAVVDNRVKLTSITPVAAGTGAKSFVVQPGGASSAWLATLASGTPFYVFSAGIGATSQQYMLGTATAYDSGTNTLTINVTLNTLPAGTYSDWVFGTDFPTIVFANYSGSDNQSPGCGLMGWVGSSSDTPPPYSYVLALYGGSGTIPVIYAKPNGKTGMGTEEPNERLHLVGNPSGTIPAKIKLTRSLTVEHDYREGFENDATVWGGQSFVKLATVRPTAADDERYPGITYPVHEYFRGRKSYDVYKVLDQGATFETILTVATGSESAAFFVDVDVAGSTTGQGSWAATARYVVFRSGATLTVTQIGNAVYGYGAGFATPHAIQVTTSGTNVLVRLRGGNDAANATPLTRAAYGTVRIVGCPTKGGGFINTSMT